MALSEQDLADIDRHLAAPPPVAALMTALRARFPGLSLTRCDPSDLDGDEPFRRYDEIDLHLVDGGGHCWSLTREPSRATGLVVVLRRRTP